MCVKSSPCSTSSTRPNTRSMGRRTVKYSNSSSTDSSRRANSSSPSRKSIRPKKKPKYLSLRLDISQENSRNMANHRPPSQLNLFPLHPENRPPEEEDMQEVEAELAQEYDDQDHEHVSYFLINPDEEDPSTSLTAILTESTTACADGGSPGEESRTYGGYRERDIGSSLMRSALRRNRAREDVSEEKWVSYSEVIVEEKKEEEVSSCSYFGNLHQRRLSLKLDYQEVLDAWCNKGSLFVGGDSPQTVPETDGGLLFGHHPDAASALWTVPDIMMSKTNTMEDEVANDMGGEGQRMARQREASVLRYKEKRQNRLFSKRIRYEVRKLNAEKRPRMKGRFVKRDS